MMEKKMQLSNNCPTHKKTTYPASAISSDFSIQPVRIQYVKGRRMRSPNGLMCTYVGKPTPFGNPYKVGNGNTLTRAEAVDAFRKLILARPLLMAQVRAKLRGKNLACWCACDGQPCHADVLLVVANG
jgi:hypothetical protein